MSWSSSEYVKNHKLKPVFLTLNHVLCFLSYTFTFPWSEKYQTFLLIQNHKMCRFLPNNKSFFQKEKTVYVKLLNFLLRLSGKAEGHRKKSRCYILISVINYICPEFTATKVIIYFFDNKLNGRPLMMHKCISVNIAWFRMSNL